MRHKDPTRTPEYIIVRQIRLLWMKSRERTTALKRDKYSCQKCGVKKSTARGKEQKVEVHHLRGNIDWKAIAEILRKDLLCDAIHLQCLCPTCHDEITRKEQL